MNGITEVVPNKEYIIRPTTGNRIRRKFKGSLTSAISQKSKILKELESKDKQDKSNEALLKTITLKEAVDETIKYLIKLADEKDSIDMNTVFGYASNLKRHVIPYFGENRKMYKIDIEAVEKFLKFMFEKKASDKDELLDVNTIKKVYTALKWVIKYCSTIARPKLMSQNILNNIVFKNYIPKGRTYKKKKIKNHPLERLLELVAAIDKYANIRLKTQINFIADVGCRREEILGVKWSNVDFVTGEVYYDEAVTSMIRRPFVDEYGSVSLQEKYGGTRLKRLKSKYSYRTNILTPYTLELLKHYKQFKEALGLSVDDDSYIFTRWDSNEILSPISFSDEYKDFRKKYGFLDIPAHDIRHTISNLLQESGYSPEYVASYLGNTPRTLLESYTNILSETQVKMKESINNLTRNICKKNFDIEIIAKVLNSENELIDNSKNTYELLDFLNKTQVQSDNLISSVEIAKEIILKQYPQLDVFLCNNLNELDSKLETYKTFNNSSFELSNDYLEIAKKHVI